MEVVMLILIIGALIFGGYCLFSLNRNLKSINKSWEDLKKMASDVAIGDKFVERISPTFIDPFEEQVVDEVTIIDIKYNEWDEKWVKIRHENSPKNHTKFSTMEALRLVELYKKIN